MDTVFTVPGARMRPVTAGPVAASAGLGKRGFMPGKAVEPQAVGGGAIR